VVNEGAVDELLEAAFAVGRGETLPVRETDYFISGAFDQILIRKHGSDAFDLLGRVCSRYSQVGDDPSRREAYFWLLGELAYASGTTEMPAELQAIIDQNRDLAGRLKSWYRL
jgi:hypothetical protein